jgi:anti-sigma factor RsiW
MEEKRERDPDCLILSARLAALLDGELSLPQRRELELHLRTCTRCAAELELVQLARATLRDAATRLAAPDELRRRVEAALAGAARPAGARRHVLHAVALAAAVAVIVALGLLGFALRQAPNASLLHRVSLAHTQETLSAQPVAFASDDAMAVEIWLRQQASEDVDVPSLSSTGFELMGARLDPAVAPHAVTLVYRGADGPVSCVILPSMPPSFLRAPLSLLHGGVHPASIAGTQLASWVARDGTYVLAGDLPPAELLSLARTAAAADTP